jgi:hypothetical protein
VSEIAKGISISRATPTTGLEETELPAPILSELDDSPFLQNDKELGISINRQTTYTGRLT